MKMIKQEAINYIESLSSGLTRKKTAQTPLDNPGRARILLSSVGDPDRRLKFVHVCGSNGKGSVCAILDAILRAAGLRVGLFTSPHLQDFCERIRVNGRMIDGSELARLTERLAPAADAMTDKPGLFCFLTALALTYFAEQQCDIVILETGLGGMHDATNVIACPEVAVVTNIGLEHTDILGDTIAEITEDKAGIIKPGCICAAYRQDPQALLVLKRKCEACQVPLHITDFSNVQKAVLSDKDQHFRKTDPLTAQLISIDGEIATLSLPGSYQLKNTALALTAVDALNMCGWHISKESVTYGLGHVKWPARFEVLSRNPLFILDGGHNPQCARALVESLDEIFPDTKVLFLVGMMRDKNYQETLSLLDAKAAAYLCVTPPDQRGLPAYQLAAYLRSCGSQAKSFDNTADALHCAVQNAGDMPVIAFGSLYLAGEIRDLMGFEP